MTPREWAEGDVPQPVALEMEGLARDLFEAILDGRLSDDEAVRAFDQVLDFVVAPAEGKAVAA